MHTLYVDIQSISVARLDLVCGKEFATLQALLELLDENLQILNEYAQKALDVLACERIAPLYSRSVYTGTCDYSMKSMTWWVTSSLVVAFAGMIMLTVRSVLWEFDESIAAPDEHARTKKTASLHDVQKEKYPEPLDDEDETEVHDDHHEAEHHTTVAS